MKQVNDSNYSCSYGAVMDELRYIKSINPIKPGNTFNNDPASFAEYCNMQANAFNEWHQQAEEMRQCRDIAQPNYRSIARMSGRTVNGTIVSATP